jgi:hypothetical protein
VKRFVLVPLRLHKFSLTTQVFKIRDVPLRNLAISLIRKFELTASMLRSVKCAFGRQWTIRNDTTVQRVDEAVQRTLRNKCRLINSLRSITNFKMLPANYLNVHDISTFQNVCEINTFSSVM